MDTTVFTHRFQCAGMKWGMETGTPVLALRVIALSGIWPKVRDAMFESQTNKIPQLPINSTTQTGRIPDKT